MHANYYRVILSIECARGKTCLRMTAFCTATGRHVQVTILTTDAARVCPNRVKFSESGYADDKSSAFSGPSTDNRGASSPINIISDLDKIKSDSDMWEMMNSPHLYPHQWRVSCVYLAIQSQSKTTRGRMRKPVKTLDRSIFRDN